MCKYNHLDAQPASELTTAELMHELISRMKHRYTTVRPALRRELIELLEDDDMHAARGADEQVQAQGVPYPFDSRRYAARDAVRAACAAWSAT